MKATIHFQSRARGCQIRTTTTETAENDIRYWLGKGIGNLGLDDITVIPEGEHESWLWVQDKMREEEAAYAAKMAERTEREEYERLKARFEGGNYTPRKTSYIVRHTLNALSEWKVGMSNVTFDIYKNIYRTETEDEGELRANLTCDRYRFVRISQDPVFPEEQCAWFEEEGLVD